MLLLPIKTYVSLLISLSGFLPSRDNTIYTAPINIPDSITKFYPLPQQEMTLSYSRGQSYLASGKFEQALIEFNRAIDIQPNVIDFWYSKGIAEEKLLKWDDAINDYKKAIDLKKIPFARDDPYLYNNLANAEVGKEDYSNALEHFSYAIKLDPKFEAPAVGKALVLYQIGKEDEALQYFKNLHEKYPNYADGNAILALMIKDNDLDTARDLFEEVIKQDSRYSDLDWVKNIRRLPPKLVNELPKFLSTLSTTTTM